MYLKFNIFAAVVVAVAVVVAAVAHALAQGLECRKAGKVTAQNLEKTAQKANTFGVLVLPEPSARSRPQGLGFRGLLDDSLKYMVVPTGNRGLWKNG